MKNVLRVMIVLPLIVVIFGAGFLVGAGNPAILAQAQDRQPPETDKLFAPFWDAWRIVHDRYVDPIDDQRLMEGAASGMLAALGDRHTAYMAPELFESLNSDLAGEFEGIGATVRKDDATGGLQILNTIEGSPARAGGVKSGDIIVMVDGTDVTRMTESDILGKVRGPAGTEVKLGLLRKGEKKLVDITLTRAKIQIPVVESTLYEGGIGYIRLAEFTDNAMDSLRKQLKDLHPESLKGLIFDLRDNPGGGLQTAIDVASLFIKEGTVVIERGRPGTDNVYLKATGKTMIPANVPMVLLVNSGSASASEILAGALKDYKRATIVGTNTYGKGSVQIWTRLNGGGGVRVTIAHFFSPNDHIIHERGVAPDVLVNWDYEASPDYDPQLAEAFRVLRGEF